MGYFQFNSLAFSQSFYGSQIVDSTMRTCKDINCNPLPFSITQNLKMSLSTRVENMYRLSKKTHLHLKQSKTLSDICSYLAGFKRRSLEVATVSDTLSGPASHEFLFVDPLEIQIRLARSQFPGLSIDNLIEFILIDFQIDDGRFVLKQGAMLEQQRK